MAETYNRATQTATETTEASPTTAAQQRGSESLTQGTKAPAAPEAPAPKRNFRPLLIFFALAVVAFIVWRVFFATPKLPAGIVALSGRVEGDDSALAPKTSGRILEIRVREGDMVTAGQIVAILDDEQLRAREDQARAVLADAEAKAQAARDQVAVLQDQLRQNDLATNQSRIDASGRVGQAQADLATAQADLVQQQAALRIAEFNRGAYTRLAQTGAVSQQQGLQAAATADQQAAAVAAAERRVESARAALTMAQASLENPPIRSAAAEGVRKQLAQQEAQIRAANAQTAQARGQLAEAQANRSDLTLLAPFSGTVVTRAAEPGEVVQAGTAIITLLDLSKVYLRGFIPEGQIGQVKVGQPAHVFLDSDPQRALEAYVSRVDPQATFTPENTYFQQDRVKQVVGVKLQLKEAAGYAKPGMPADGEVLVSGDTWPPHKRKVQ